MSFLSLLQNDRQVLLALFYKSSLEGERTGLGGEPCSSAQIPVRSAPEALPLKKLEYKTKFDDDDCFI